MRKLLGLVIIAFMFVACGNSPEEVVTKYTIALVEFDFTQMAKYTYKSEKEKEELARAKEEVAKAKEELAKVKEGVIETHGKEAFDKAIKSIKTSLINKTKYAAEVKVTRTKVDGEVINYTMHLIKIDGTWYINPKKSSTPFY